MYPGAQVGWLSCAEPRCWASQGQCAPKGVDDGDEGPASCLTQVQRFRAELSVKNANGQWQNPTTTLMLVIKQPTVTQEQEDVTQESGIEMTAKEVELANLKLQLRALNRRIRLDRRRCQIRDANVAWGTGSSATTTTTDSVEPAAPWHTHATAEGNVAQRVR